MNSCDCAGLPGWWHIICLLALRKVTLTRFPVLIHQGHFRHIGHHVSVQLHVEAYPLTRLQTGGKLLVDIDVPTEVFLRFRTVNEAEALVSLCGLEGAFQGHAVHCMNPEQLIGRLRLTPVGPMDEEHQGVSHPHVGRLQNGTIGIDFLATHGVSFSASYDAGLLLRIVGPQASNEARLSPRYFGGHLALEFALASSFSFALSLSFAFAFTIFTFSFAIGFALLCFSLAVLRLLLTSFLLFRLVFPLTFRTFVLRLALSFPLLLTLLVVLVTWLTPGRRSSRLSFSVPISSGSRSLLSSAGG
mmetsp:Transcript_4665/g.9959  ORF Transcript_4665/g.9959 Transcript_4665/m.9959 type:complete len:302 (+) Transcript_4665:551-1456(+)